MQLLPPLSWVAVIAIVTLIGAMPAGGGSPSCVGLCFLYLAVFGQWQSAMQTLGLDPRRGAARRGWRACSSASPATAGRGFEQVDAAGARPDADHADLRLPRADPVPVRLRPGLGDRSPPPSSPRRRWCAPRMLAPVRACPTEISGFSARWPAARARQKTLAGDGALGPADVLMVGVNQVIMLALNMVIIASMIGAGGLGYDVLAALARAQGRRRRWSEAWRIVVLAIALDRLCQRGLPRTRACEPTAGGADRRASRFTIRYSTPGAACLIAVTAGISGLFYVPSWPTPDASTATTGGSGRAIVRLDTPSTSSTSIEAFRVVAAPLRAQPGRALPREGFPGLGVVSCSRPCRLGSSAACGSRCCARCSRPCLRGDRACGKRRWPPSISAAYPVVIACLIGIPIGLAASTAARLRCREDHHTRSSTRCRCCRPSASSSRW